MSEIDKENSADASPYHTDTIKKKQLYSTNSKKGILSPNTLISNNNIFENLSAVEGSPIPESVSSNQVMLNYAKLKKNIVSKKSELVLIKTEEKEENMAVLQGKAIIEGVVRKKNSFKLPCSPARSSVVAATDQKLGGGILEVFQAGRRANSRARAIGLRNMLER